MIAAAGDYWEARTVCLDPYWVNQWMKHYDFGLIKRGFLGAILKIFAGDQVNILLLNLLFFVLGFARNLQPPTQEPSYGPAHGFL